MAKKQTAKKPTGYAADIKAAKKIGKEAMALTGKVIKEAQAQYKKSDKATKTNIKKAAVIGALGLVGMMEAGKMMKNMKKKR